MMDSTEHSHPITPYINFEKNDIETDEQLLRHIVCNLLGNAVKYSPRGKSIGLMVQEQNDKLVIEVKDYGRGISEEDQRVIFETFTRGKNVGNIPGTGLGLSIARRS